MGYNVKSQSDTSPFSRYMFHTAVIILIFLVIHIIDFYVKAKFLGGAKEITYDDEVYMHNLAALVIAKFKMPAYVIGYLIAMFALGFHLLHGFQSAFQTIGLNHKSYFPVIKVIGYVYTFVIVAGFSAIPIIVYFTR